jgi:hypothetical protein
VGRHTRGPAYPDIDIGASQTDSALMRGAAAGEGPARPRRCRVHEACSFVDFRLPHAKISGPQGGVKRLLFGCERQKSEFFMFPTMGKGTRLGVFSSRRWSVQCVSLFYVIDTGSIGSRAGRVAELGVTYLPFTISSDAGYADLTLALLGAPVSIGALIKTWVTVSWQGQDQKKKNSW